MTFHVLSFRHILFSILCMFIFINTAFAEKVRINFEGDIPAYLYTDTIKFATDSAKLSAKTPTIVEAFVDMNLYDNDLSNQMHMELTVLVDLDKHVVKTSKTDIIDLATDIKYPFSTDGNTWKTDANTYNAVQKYVIENWKTVYDRSLSSGTVASVSAYQKPETKVPIDSNKQPPNLSWNGRWSTSSGEMHLKQVGNKVEGSINGKKFSGMITNNKVVGTWSNMKFFSSFEPKGNFEFSMLEDGTHIKVRWKDQFVGWITDSSLKRLP